MTDHLSKRKCVPCRGDTPTLEDAKIAEYLGVVRGWKREGETIKKTFSFLDFKAALVFINRIGEVAEVEDHHPDISLHNHKKVTLTFTTHSVHGLTENDFVMAAKVNAIS